MNPLDAPIADPASVDAAIESRFSVRAFLPQPVPRPLIEDILRVASRAPSGTNAQPWKVYVLQGAARDEVVRQVSDAHEAIRQRPELVAEYREAYDYYPRQWVEPYLSRRRHNGWSLLGLKQSLAAQGRMDEAYAIEPAVAAAWERADAMPTSSCYCEPGGE